MFFTVLFFFYRKEACISHDNRMLPASINDGTVSTVTAHSLEAALESAKQEAQEYKERWLDAHRQLDDAKTGRAKLENQLTKLQTESQLLRKTLFQMASEMNHVQYQITASGDLKEYTIRCQEVDKLILLYQKLGWDSLLSTSFNDAYQTTQHHEVETSNKSTDGTEGSSSRKILPASSDLVTLYQSDILCLRAAKSELTKQYQKLHEDYRETIARLERSENRGRNMVCTMSAIFLLC